MMKPERLSLADSLLPNEQHATSTSLLLQGRKREGIGSGEWRKWKTDGRKHETKMGLKQGKKGTDRKVGGEGKEERE